MTPKQRPQKREYDGRYAFDGDLERLCACGHTLGFHSSGSPADCLFHTFPINDQTGKPGADKPECGCLKFRLEDNRMKKQILSQIITTLLVGIAVGGLLSVSFIFDEKTVFENSRAFFAAIWR